MHAFTVTGREIKAGDLVNVPWSPSLSSVAFGSLSAIRGGTEQQGPAGRWASPQSSCGSSLGSMIMRAWREVVFSPYGTLAMGTPGFAVITAM